MWTYLKPTVSVYEWSQVMGFNPFWAAQIGEPRNLLQTDIGQCETVFYQTAAQRNQHLSREDVAQSLLDAQQIVSDIALTNPAPLYEQALVQYPRPSRLDYANQWSGATYRLKPVAYKYGNIISMGIPEDTLLDADATVVFSDPYSDGVDTQWTVTVAVPSGTVASEVVVFYTSGDTPTDLTHADMQIYPVKVTISGLTATITGHVTQIVLVENYRKLRPEPLDATNSIYATELAVYRRTIDLTQAGTLQWDNVGGCPNPPCTYSVSAACFYATNPHLGYIIPVPGQYDEAEAQYTQLYPNQWRAPDRVLMNVISGIPRATNGMVASPWREIICYLATAIMPQQKSCGCADADTVMYYYRSEEGAREIIPTLQVAIGDAFKTIANRGAVRAYQMLMNNEQGRVYRGVMVQ